MTKVSVIMSVYNSDKWVKKSIESILSQSEKDFEFLIIDDASSDSSFKILSEYQNLDFRIKLFRNSKNFGLTKNLNTLIKLAKSEYIVRMDADDISMPNRIECQLDFIKSQKIDLCFSQTNIILDSGEELCKKWFPENILYAYKYLPYINLFTHSSLMIKKKVYEENNYYNEKFKNAQDWELWNRLVKKNYKFGITRNILHSWRLHNSGSSLKLSESSSENYSFFLSKVLLMNNQRKKSLKYLNFIPRKYLLKYFFYLIVPHKFLFFLVFLNARLNKKSPVNTLLKKIQ